MTSSHHTICVFCGSSNGNDEAYSQQAEKLGTLLAKSGHRLVYGGANVGTMNTLANAALTAGGEVVGVIPKLLAEKVVHPKLSKLLTVDSMHLRKSKMYSLSDGFIILPGGLGTLDELFECLTWRQLNLHRKPIGLLNLNGYFNNLIAFLKHAQTSGFIQQKYLDNLIISEQPEQLLSELRRQIG